MNIEYWEIIVSHSGRFGVTKREIVRKVMSPHRTTVLKAIGSIVPSLRTSGCGCNGEAHRVMVVSAADLTRKMARVADAFRICPISSATKLTNTTPRRMKWDIGIQLES